MPEKATIWGDNHANPIKLLRTLEDTGDLNIPVDKFRELESAYEQNNIEKFCRLFDSDWFTNNPEAGKIYYLGDDVADRGKNDCFNLYIFHLMHNKHIDFTILRSNHGDAFLANFGDVLDPEQLIAAANKELIELIHDPKTACRSMYNFAEYIRKNMDQLTKIVSWIESYKTHLKPIVVTYQVNGTATIMTHAPLTRAFLTSFETQEPNNSYGKSAPYTPELFAEKVSTAMTADPYSQSINPTSTPVQKYLLWNRRRDNFTSRINYPKVINVHGHGTNSIQHSPVHRNLDNENGKDCSCDVDKLKNEKFSIELFDYESELAAINQELLEKDKRDPKKDSNQSIEFKFALIQVCKCGVNPNEAANKLTETPELVEFTLHYSMQQELNKNQWRILNETDNSALKVLKEFNLLGSKYLASAKWVSHIWLQVYNDCKSETRGLMGVVTLSSFYMALKYIPLMNAVLLNNTRPLIIPLLVWMFMGHKTPMRLIVFIALGFLGVILVLHPALHTFKWTSLYALLSGVSAAAATLTTRQLSKSESKLKIMTYYFLIAMFFSGIFVIHQWTSIGFESWLILIVIGLIATVYQLALTTALSLAPARVISPLMFFSLVIAGIIDWYFYNELPGLMPLVGMGLIIISAIAVVVFNHARVSKRSTITT